MRNLIIAITAVILSNHVSAEYMTSKELRNKYPNITQESTRAEKKEILCPFWRLIERSGALDMYRRAKKSDVIVSIRNIIRNAKEFGCSGFECGAVATLVATGQKTYWQTTNILHVNLSKLHKARGVAHDCGFTFEKDGTQVSNTRRSQTLSRLKLISQMNDVAGTLSKEDLMSVKLKICSEESVKISGAGKVEVGLIFSFLGGNDRGFIEYSDVERFFHAQMPMTKAIDKI